MLPNTDVCVQVELIRRDYVANSGWETFLSYEDPEQDILIGLLRLRRCSPQSFRPELKGGVSIVRELHVYGSVVPVSSRDPSKFQHQVAYTFTHMHTQQQICLWRFRSEPLRVFLHTGRTSEALNVFKPIVFVLRVQGFGMMLMEEAERIARDEHGSCKLAVISGESMQTMWTVLTQKKQTL